MGYRFRLEGELLVLQVPEAKQSGYFAHESTWRDATIHDIPVMDPFRDPLAKRYQEVGEMYPHGLVFQKD